MSRVAQYDNYSLCNDCSNIALNFQAKFKANYTIVYTSLPTTIYKKEMF